MPKYALDTNVYIDASRQADALRDVIEFARAKSPDMRLSAVVLHEVLAGARSAQHARSIETELAGPFDRAGRIFSPSPSAWRRASSILRPLQKPGGRTPNAALVNDVLIALSCRELGITLITRDGDFGDLRALIPGLSVAAPFPD